MESTALHDRTEPDRILTDPKILERITVHQQEIREKPVADLTDRKSHELTQGGSGERLRRRIAKQVDEELEVTGVAADWCAREAVISAREDTDTTTTCSSPPRSGCCTRASMKPSNLGLIERRRSGWGTRTWIQQCGLVH